MKFVGHLDMMRYFQKAIRRARIPIRYSEGFSPHQIMSFAAPRGVGITSRGEYLDIEVTESPAETEAASFFRTMKDRLSQAMVEEIRILSCRKLPDACKNAMSIVCAADYTLSFREGHEPKDPEAFFEKLAEFYAREQILVTKQTKKGQRDLDLKPLIYCLERRENRIFMQVSTGSTDNVKPEFVMETFYREMGWESPGGAFQIQREEVYGRDAAGHPIPLEEFGENIE